VTTKYGVFFILLAGLSAAGDASCGEAAGLHISGNGRYFVTEDGQPFFWQGDTEWELFHLFSLADAKEFLLNRRNQGFNVIQVMVTGVYPEWGASKGMKPWKEQQAWLDNNPLTPNEEYFKRADAIVAAAQDSGIVLVLGVYHARDQDFGRINASNVHVWARWLAQRYKNAKNIVWSMYPHANLSSEPVVRAAVRGLQEGGGAHLITLHPDPSPTSSSFMHSEFWLSFNTLQTWSTDLMNYDMVRSDFMRSPVKPVVDGEARYEKEDGTTPLAVRRAGYWACLAGGFYSYGHRDNWMSPQTWRTWYDTPGARQIKIMGDLFRSIDWWRLVPDQSIFTDWTKGDVAARSSGGDWILAYLTSSEPVNLKLSVITSSDWATAWWVDPVTGARTIIGTFPTSRVKEFSPPNGWQDAVLLIEKKTNEAGKTTR
jgi:Protein of unknown function (DUF4038)/Putative collagen-binding domain of a collagenase